jgi:predicted nucleic acid-binding protein
MANVFIDSNILFDITERDITRIKMLNKHDVSISALSFHIIFYTYKYKIPNEKLNQYYKQFHIISMTDNILRNSMIGPTSDLEDNIQLHSAVKKDSDYFLTSDKKLLKMKFFGRTKIVSTL